MALNTANLRRSKRHIEVIPKNAEFEENIGSFGDETPSDDTGDQEGLSNRKRKRPTGSNVSSKEKEKESGLGSEQEENQAEDVPYTKKTRKKTSQSWKYLEEFEVDSVKFARCTLCRTELKHGPTCSTSSLNRHVNKCKAAHGIGLQKQAQLQFQAGDNSSEVTLANFRYDHAEMRKTISHYILVNELPFIHIESFMFNELMRKATPHCQKISRATVRSDCMTTYEIEKKKLKDVFKSVKRINITTDMWTSSTQKIGYMVITAHWIDYDWKLNMRVICFCNVPPPHSGYIIADAISKCLNDWEIEDKIGIVSVDNAKANDVALRTLKDMYNIRKTALQIGGKLFQVRCCAHILNLCVQDGLESIKEIVDKIRDGVKYVAASEGRRIKFAEIAKHLHLKNKKLILDVLTRWNSTFKMLQCAVEYKQVFELFPSSDKGFEDYVPDVEDWEQVEGVCSILEAFNVVTNIVSGTHYPTSNLFLAEIRKVKQILDRKSLDQNLRIREMVAKMKLKFDKYWGQSNLVISIGAVMDPRFKMKLPMFCFPTLYPLEGEADRNLAYLVDMLNELYQEYYLEDKAKSTDFFESSQVSSDNYTNMDERETPQGINEYESSVRESGAAFEPMKSELDDYLAEKIVIPAPNCLKSFDVLAWWKGNSAKYPILSIMARDILGIPMSTVASESTFSAGRRVIEPHRSCLKPETVEMLLCGADWVRELYGLKKPIKDAPKAMEVIEIDLDFNKMTI